MILGKKVIEWYNDNKRDLPWRETKDPYFIWISEIILQQTRVNQGLPYYYRFISKFKTVFELADASEDEVLSLWQGLGYYSRARNMHSTAKFIVDQFNGTFPNNFNDLLKLKGVGNYTAAAIASFAFDESIPAIDGNAIRVISRYFGISEPVNSASTQKIIHDLANQCIQNNNPALFNQAMMEFGALACLPKNPNCLECSLSSSCISFNQNLQNTIPIKKGKTKTRARFINYLHFETQIGIPIIKRTGNDIWKNLYDLPFIETLNPINKAELNVEIIKKCLIFNFIVIDNPLIIKHILSHQIIYATFWTIHTSDHNFLKKNYLIWQINNLIKLPKSRLLDKYFIIKYH